MHELYEAEKRLALARARLRATRGTDVQAVVEFFAAKDGFRVAVETIAEAAYREGYNAAAAN